MVLMGIGSSHAMLLIRLSDGAVVEVTEVVDVGLVVGAAELVVVEAGPVVGGVVVDGADVVGRLVVEDCELGTSVLDVGEVLNSNVSPCRQG
jgi:hypothetical protein